MCSGGVWWRFEVWGLCVFVIKSVCWLWVFNVVVRLDSDKLPHLASIDQAHL